MFLISFFCTNLCNLFFSCHSELVGTSSMMLNTSVRGDIFVLFPVSGGKLLASHH